jgi:outer membrane murein-binding lipoprotein Lpp
MFTSKLVAIGAAAAVTLILAGCSGTDARVEQPQSTVKPIAGTSVQQVQLTEQAMQRLGITTGPVQTAAGTQPGQGARTVIPYSAVVYDTDGSTWAYVNTAARTFVRQSIDVRAIDGSAAVLARGPAVGTAVVTVGAPELLGAEYDISGE